MLKQKATAPNTLNFAGGEAHSQSQKAELISMMLTSFLSDQYYRSAEEGAQRITALVNEIADKEFVAKAALYARREAGMRSVSHLVAGEIAHSVKGEEWTKRFFERLIVRADDVLEILAYCIAVYGKPLPNSLKKGLGLALAKLDDYELAKYRRNAAEIKMVDAVNLVHPPHTDSIRRLVSGELSAADTWETKLSEAGEIAQNERERKILKAKAWSDLVLSGKIGYFALLRNLRNILEQAPELTDEVAELLSDETRVRRSRVLPFRFRTAMDVIDSLEGHAWERRKIVQALNQAVDHSLANVPRFEGRTLVAMDCSGSMIGKPMKIGSLFASILYKTNDADLMLFSSSARWVRFNADDATLSIAKRIESQAEWCGTDFHSIFRKAQDAYDRIIILSDMQAWIGHHTPKHSFKRYIDRVGKRPRVYTFDLAGYGTMQFPERDVYALAGFSDKALQTMQFLEKDKQALVREIESISL